MPTRLQISGASHDWTAEVSGAHVTLTPGEPLAGSREGERLHVEGPAASVGGFAAVAGDVVWVTVAGEVFSFTVTHGARRAKSESRDHDAFTPPMSATVVRILAKAGDAVKSGDILIALEAMKMELPIRSPRDGVVRKVNCAVGDLVQPDQMLIELD